MRRWLVWTLVAAAAGGAVLWATVLAPEPIAVKVVPVTRGRVESTVTNTKAGTVRARHRAQISPQVGGEVVEVAHREGEAVKRGDVLVRLDDATERAQLQLAEESARAAEALQQQSCIQRDRARRELARKRELAAEKIVSADLLDSLQSAYDAANAACSAAAAEAGRARAQIAAIQVELDKLVLRAPFDGVLAEVDVEVGEWITPSPPLLPVPAAIDLIDPTSLYVSAPMDEVDSAAIHTGQRAVVSVDSHPGQHFAGRVVRVAPYVLDVEAQNRTVEIEVELDDPSVSAQLLPGTSADVEVVLETRENVLRIPTPALLEGERVLVAAHGRLAERKVEIGLKNWDWAEVRSGLAEGELVVTSLDRTEVVAGARVIAEETEYRP
jgi:HlyD family secretion protein